MQDTNFGPGFAIQTTRARAPACLFTVDVEDWFHSNFVSLRDFDASGLPRRVEEGVASLLDELAQVRGSGTFFVLGTVAEQHPSVVRRIAEAGHEVGCHSLNHTLLYEQNPETLRADLTRARKVLQDQSGQPVLGFRAPSWSITTRSLWALDVLTELGFRYDSSIFPAKNYLYGMDNVPADPYEIQTPSGARITEIPPSTLSLGPRRIGVGGGVYLRAFPLMVQRYAMQRALARGAPFVLYVHPREFDVPAWRYRLPLSRQEQWIHSFGLKRGHARLRRLLREGSWRSMASLLPPAN
ncbi:MAG TPA: polysaccharide deacetylase family protein [Polyangiaceae bacterium]|nr:polysaccharide deacetylase family protein [Polyangiaceae bacterium]